MSSTITFTGSNFCAGNGHFTLTISGAKSAVYPMQSQQVVAQDPSPEEIRTCVLTLMQLWANGKTPTQAKTAILAGFNVVIG